MNASSLTHRFFGSIDQTKSPGLWRAIAGFCVWAVAFTVLYTSHALGCLWVQPHDEASTLMTPAALTALLVGFWVLFVFGLLMMTVRSGIRVRRFHTAAQRRSSHFMVMLTFISDASAVIATVISGLPVIMSPVCM